MSRILALIGNPNSGKTTLFNALTGDRQYVGNWAGVTVEKKCGKTLTGGHTLVDLPGIYALSPYSMEERVTQAFLLHDAPDGILNIIDGTNMERNLYLTLQLLELRTPMVVAVNMMDAVERQGGHIDCAYLSGLLGVPVLPISARSGDGVEAVLQQIERQMEKRHIPPELPYPRVTQNALNRIGAVILARCQSAQLPYAFLAAKLLEGDPNAAQLLALDAGERAEIRQIARDYEAQSPYPDREALLADARYRLIQTLVEKAVGKGDAPDAPTRSDRIDRIVTHRLLAFPIFLLVMLGMFLLTFGTIGSALHDGMEAFFHRVLTPAVQSMLTQADAPDWTRRLLVDAVIGGVGGVLVFLSQIAILFFCLSLLEDSGYMARAAFLSDRLLHRLGLSGKSFIPMLMGFGCTTPAVMAARTEESMGERRMTIMLVPFLSCGAKLPIYALFAGTFFAAHQGLVVFSMYALGLFLAILVGMALKATLFRENSAPFLMELPPYRMPLPRSVLKSTGEKCKGFVVKAGTVIFAMSIVIWLLQNLSPSLQLVDDSTQSCFARLGGMLAPIFRPLGFGDWRAAVALLSGLVAKEAVVSTMGVLYGANDPAALSSAIAGAFTPLSAYAFMAFCLLYIPCISAFATIRREMNSWRWALGVAALQFGVAYLVSLAIYQIGSLFV